MQSSVKRTPAAQYAVMNRLATRLHVNYNARRLPTRAMRNQQILK